MAAELATTLVVLAALPLFGGFIAAVWQSDRTIR
jgi:hypothetical protein